MTREEILAVYACGPEAVVALVQALWSRIETQQQQIQAQQAQIEALTGRVKALEDGLAKDSHNSSKPPSSDIKKPKTRSQRTSRGKPPGGQPGHPGETLRMRETPDQVLVHSPTECVACGTSLWEVAGRGYERRQVFEVPPLKLEVIEHRAEVKNCPHCAQRNKGRFPEAVTQPVQYGDRVKALGVYFTEYQMLSYERTSETFADLFGQAVLPATVHGSNETCYIELASAEEAIKEHLRQADVLHADESGLYVAGKRAWIHVSSAAEWTHYEHHAKRGKAATDAIDILPKFHGTAVHDGYGSYPQYKACDHALCNAHHLRELTFIEEEYQQAWAGRMKALLLEIKGRVANAQALGATELETPTQQAFVRRYQAILRAGAAANPVPAATGPPDGPKKRGRKKQSPAKNLLDRLRANRAAVLAFMRDFRVPFDNNLAERDLRMVKVKQKISGCFRSEEGAQYFCRIRSYISTVKKQGGRVLEALEQVFKGNPMIPSPKEA